MERTEPTLVPEWLKGTGNNVGGGSSVHHSTPSLLNSESHLSLNHVRSRSLKSVGEFDDPHPHSLERVYSANSCRLANNNGFVKNPYSNFTRSYRDKDRDKEKERASLIDNRDSNCFDSTSSIICNNRIDKDVYKRSHSMISGKQLDVLSQKIIDESKCSISDSSINGNHAISVGNTVNGINKATFDKDFPSLGSDVRQGIMETSEVSTGYGSNDLAPTTYISTIAIMPGPHCSLVGLNMAETLSQAPSKTRTIPQLSVHNQRLEELALKQSRQLIPMTPSITKASVFNSSDKPKPRVAAAASKSGMQQFPSPQPAGPSLRTLPIRPDNSKIHSGKYLVLKPVWENGISSVSKDSISSANNRAANSQISSPITMSSSPSRSSPKISPVDPRSSSLSTLNVAPLLEKRPSPLQVQSRNEFFDLMRKKSAVGISSPVTDLRPSLPHQTKSECLEEVKVGAIPDVTEAAVPVPVCSSTSNGCETAGHLSDDGIDSNCSQNTAELEEETRFLRSLGWEENSGEDEGLTEEEINAFFEEYVKLKPSLKQLRRNFQSKQHDDIAATADAVAENSPSPLI